MLVLHDGFKGVFYRGIFDETVRQTRLKADMKAVWQKHAIATLTTSSSYTGLEEKQTKSNSTDRGYSKCITKYL